MPLLALLVLLQTPVELYGEVGGAASLAGPVATEYQGTPASPAVSFEVDFRVWPRLRAVLGLGVGWLVPDRFGDLQWVGNVRVGLDAVASFAEGSVFLGLQGGLAYGNVFDFGCGERCGFDTALAPIGRLRLGADLTRFEPLILGLDLSLNVVPTNGGFVSLETGVRVGTSFGEPVQLEPALTEPHRFEVGASFDGVVLLGAGPPVPMFGGAVEAAVLPAPVLRLRLGAAGHAIPALDSTAFRGVVGADVLAPWEWGVVYGGAGVGFTGSAAFGGYGPLLEVRTGVDVNVWSPVTVGLRVGYEKLWTPASFAGGLSAALRLAWRL